VEQLIKLLNVGVGGAIGAIGRYWLSGLAQQFEGRFPLGTLAVNLLGSLLMGFLAVLFIEKLMVNQELRLFLLVGVLGAFTTYSTFSYETLMLVRSEAWLMAGLNILTNVIGTLLAVWGGYTLAKLW